MGSFVEDNTEAMAFILVIAAGLATGIGASVVFFPRLASLANRNVLAISLGLASGVMLYISLVDIYGKSIVGYGEANQVDVIDEDTGEPLIDAKTGEVVTEPDDGYAFILATITYFCGCFLMLLLDKGVDLMIHHTMKGGGAEDAAAAAFYGSSANVGEELDKMRENFEEKQALVKASTMNKDIELTENVEVGEAGGSQNEQTLESQTSTAEMGSSFVDTTAEAEAAPLKHMSWTMFLAIAIHNFPEGMVTYIAYVDDEAVGVALAIGIAIHNIPEGLCVAMPMYYATGRRMYSFLMGTLSGLSEVLGALLAWVILGADSSGNANGALFGLVSGMMSVISIQELLPTAHRYSTNPNQVTYAFLFGAFMIALSLMLFS